MIDFTPTEYFILLFIYKNKWGVKSEIIVFSDRCNRD